MNKKSKFISGLSKKGTTTPHFYFSDGEKIDIVEDYLSSGCTKREIWHKYTGQQYEHGQIKRWMRRFGYSENYPKRFIPKSTSSPRMRKEGENIIPINLNDEFENLKLERRIKELENQLKDAEMKAITFSTMIDIAEKQFNIPIRKKSNTKPSKK